MGFLTNNRVMCEPIVILKKMYQNGGCCIYPCASKLDMDVQQWPFAVPEHPGG